MPFLTDLKCSKCGHQEEHIFKSFEDFQIQLPTLFCRIMNSDFDELCGGALERVYQVPQIMECKEGDEPVSSKSSKYWRNAETNRLKDMHNKREVKREKEYYGGR